VAAECGGATAVNGEQDFDVLPANPLAVALDEGSSRGADHIVDLMRFPEKLCRGDEEGPRILALPPSPIHNGARQLHHSRT
jgi:hypothetical protein